MKVEILTTPACSNCSIVEKIFDEIGVSYKIIDVTEHPEYLEKYPIFTAPGIVIDDKLEFIGIPSKKELINRMSPKTELPIVKLIVKYLKQCVLNHCRIK